MLDELAAQDIANAQAITPYAWLGLPVLSLEPLVGLSVARQRNALRYWLAPLTRLPDTDHWVGWETLRDAAPDALPLSAAYRGCAVSRLGAGVLRPTLWHRPPGTVESSR